MSRAADIDPRVPLLVFSPYDGFTIQWMATREAYREHHPELEWRFNPWTGEPRHPSDIASDPKGFLIWDNAWGPLRAARQQPVLKFDECCAQEGLRPGDPIYKQVAKSAKHLRFDPATGAELPPGTTTAADYERTRPLVTWRFDPWTGARRDEDETRADPYGRLFVGTMTRRPSPEEPFAHRGIMTLDEIAAAEVDPTGRDAHTPGAKMDAGKPRVWLCVSGFSRALGAVAEVTTRGAEKYAPNSWMEVPGGADRYMEGFARHALALGRGETHDTGPGGTGCLHKAQMIWNLLASLELELRAGGTA